MPGDGSVGECCALASARGANEVEPGHSVRVLCEGHEAKPGARVPGTGHARPRAGVCVCMCVCVCVCVRALRLHLFLLCEIKRFSWRRHPWVFCVYSCTCVHSS